MNQIDTNLIGQDYKYTREGNGIDYNFSYTDNYLAFMDEKLPVKNFQKLVTNSKMFEEMLYDKLDIGVGSYISAHVDEVTTLFKQCVKENQWLGWVEAKKNPQEYLTKLLEKEHSRLTASRSGRGSRELLINGFYLSPNKEINSDFDGRLILMPSQKLIDLVDNFQI